MVWPSLRRSGGIGCGLTACFPLWLSPLLIVVGVQAVMGYSTVFSPVRYGLAERLSSALAALVCGGFLEMWNFQFRAMEIYSALCSGFASFEMPLLGYAGSAVWH